jgi:hypothetical protein
MTVSQVARNRGKDLLVATICFSLTVKTVTRTKPSRVFKRFSDRVGDG